MNVGDKVLCVDDRFDPEVAVLYTALPKKGVVYVIRDIRIGIQPDCKTGDVSLLLVGLVNPRAESRSALERGFSASRFRRLEEVKERARQGEPAALPAEVEPVSHESAAHDHFAA
jgi:hypothetical protein